MWGYSTVLCFRNQAAATAGSLHLPSLRPAQVAVVEAMKMRNVLRAAVEGVVKSVEALGGVVAAGQPIVRFE